MDWKKMLNGLGPATQAGRRTVLTLVCVVATLCVSAGPVTRQQAQQRAEAFLKNKAGSRKLTPVTSSRKLAPRRGAAAQEPYYVFNRGEGEGYVIMPGDDAIETPLGYTDAGDFDYQSIPDNMRSWLDGYAGYVEALLASPEAAKTRAKVPVHAAISPMLTCTWNQGSPYNDECPMYFTLGRSVTGCVATAMAQILYFQRAKSVTEVQADIPAYTTWTSHETYGRLSVEGIAAGSPIDWDNMLDSYGSGATAKQRLAVAQLMHYCGVSVQMDYTNSSSGAQSSMVPEAMNKYFGYSTARYVSRSSYSDDNWDALIYNELEQGRVVYLSGANSEAGHAFVTDGYDGNHCYHINWGWGGSSNGYFLLSSLNPSSQGIGGSGDGYNQYQDAVIGCEPDNYGEKEMPIANATVKALCLANWDTDGDGKFSFGEAAAVTDLGTVFKGQKFSAFTELYNFTGLTAISDSAFYGCTTLSSLKLPKALKRIGAHAFDGCRALKTFKLPDNLTEIGQGAFAGCRVLPNQTLPAGLEAIADSTFAGCVAFTSVELPISVLSIGRQVFAGCTKLTDFTLNAIRPQDIVLGSDVFEGIALSKAKLTAVQGAKAYLAQAEQWRDFGTIYEVRSLSGGSFAEIATGKYFYIYNEGTGRYMTKGEAWGTQAVVGSSSPMRFRLYHTTAMPDGVYYLYSTDTGNDGHILFRTSTDTNVGSGVKACFVDGETSHTTDKTAWWDIQQVGDALYTIQVPSTVAGYQEGRYLGVQTDHASNAASPTYGAYSDVDYEAYTRNCQWRFVTYDETAAATYEAAQVLGNLLAMAESKISDYAFEQAVFDNMDSSLDEMLAAQRTLRKKLGLIQFKDDALRSVAIGAWDVNGDGELSYSEASKVTDFGYYTLYGYSFADLSDLQYFTKADVLYGNTFEGCTTLRTITLPPALTTLYYRVFRNCTKLTAITLPETVEYIGDNTFDGCTALKSVTVGADDPSAIALGDDLFKNVTLRNATLYVPAGSKDLYADAPVWKDFGNIVEVRGHVKPGFSPIEENVPGYLYNLGERKYLNQGEAWGTQAIVATQGMTFQFRRSTSLPEGVYYLSSGSGTMFRTSADSKVGTGVKACYVDGSVGATAYWDVVQDGENIYRLQVPETDATYVEGECLGTQTDHASSAASPTYGAYWDVPESYGDAVRWAFVTTDEMKAAQAFNNVADQLKQLLGLAVQRGIDVADEQAVYDNMDSTKADLEDAILSVRRKLGYIDFADSRAKAICVNNWDADDDGELSYEEAAAVTTIGTSFRSAATMKSFEELRYFTGLTALDDEAFNGCSALVSLYVPAGVRTIGAKAFNSCTALKYMAVLAPQVVSAASASVRRTCTVFVPSDVLEDYQQDADWNVVTLREYTGVPTVTADSYTRAFGRANPRFTYTVTGAPVNGEPQVALEEVLNPDTEKAYTATTLPIGQYEIVVTAGTITSPGLLLVAGTLTVADPTAVETVRAAEPTPKADGTVYDLSGRRVTRQPLAPGLYIINGQKVLVK